MSIGKDNIRGDISAKSYATEETAKIMCDLDNTCEGITEPCKNELVKGVPCNLTTCSNFRLFKKDPSNSPNPNLGGNCGKRKPGPSTFV